MELGPSIDETTAYFTVLSLAAIMGTPTRSHWSDIFEMSQAAIK